MFDEIEQATGIDPYEPITEEDEGFPAWLPILLYPLIVIAWVIGLFPAKKCGKITNPRRSG